MPENKILFMCPRRKEPGPWQELTEDSWRENQWEKGENWKIDFIPRVCDFCGGIHPEDAIKLLELGWEVECTTKRYKRYIHPKGFKERMKGILKSIAKKDGDISKETNDSYWQPKPNVKLYIMHFSDKQIDRFNKVLNHEKENNK